MPNLTDTNTTSQRDNADTLRRRGMTLTQHAFQQQKRGNKDDIKNSFLCFLIHPELQVYSKDKMEPENEQIEASFSSSNRQERTPHSLHR